MKRATVEHLYPKTKRKPLTLLIVYYNLNNIYEYLYIYVLFANNVAQ